VTVPPVRRRRRRRRLSAVLPLVGLAVVFGLGVALGEALNDNPKPGGTQTIVRTLKPLPLAPAPTKTVTVTVSKS
jgi:hypothetical protein